MSLQNCFKLASLFLIYSTSLLWADIQSISGTIGLDVDEDGTAELTLNSTGLGIGTTPSANLHVAGNAIVTGALGIGTSNLSSNLNISGTMGLGFVSVSSDTTVSDRSLIFAGNSSGNITVTIPSASSVDGRVVTIKKTNANNIVTVATQGGTIDGSLFGDMGTGNILSLPALKLIASGGNWHILGQDNLFLYSQTTPFEDAFTDDDRTVNPTWYFATGSPTLNQSGGVIGFTGYGASNAYLSSTWSGTTLSNTGDNLILTVTFKYDDTGSSIDSRDQEMNFAIGYNNGTDLTADVTGTVSDDIGYFMAIGGSGSGASGTAISEDAGGDRWLGSNSDVTDLTTSNTGPYAAETFKTFTMSIVLNGSGGYDIDLSDGTTTISATDATPVTTTFNLITFGWYGRNASNVLEVDSISVTHIPGN